ncbi:hypothetical protein OAE61_00695 [Verrucomicrobiales bacterium]|nr:hypothetical protein [Verrucomicrobiales bacterium]MDC0322037.1 hypothetical protein [Verrucomicrobiales bacterium]
MRVKDLVQRPTETILVTNLLELLIEEWAASEAVSEKDIERMPHQIGDWMMDWKAIHGGEVAVGCDTVRIGRTEAGRPYCRILGGGAVDRSAEAVSAMRALIGSVLMWNQQRRLQESAPDTSRKFTQDSSLNDLDVDPKSWLGWLLADHPNYRPPLIRDWLLGENPEYRDETIRRVAHHELGPDSPWGELNP